MNGYITMPDDTEDDYVPDDSDAPDAPPESGGNGKAESSAPPVTAPRAPVSPVEIVSAWSASGPLIRIPTGIPALDRACRGGLPVPWRGIIVGAPSAGKTFNEITIADHIARNAAESGAVVGILAVDEEPEDITVRLAQIAGFSVEDAERRDPTVLAAMADALREVPIHLFDATHTIESAAAHVAQLAKASGGFGVLFIDSIQAVRSLAALNATTPREIVEANVVAMRVASVTMRLLVIATSEANRASYRNDSAAAESNDLAAGAESRAIEFGAQTMLMLRTPKDHPDVIHVRIAKNRRAYVGEFWLKLDREHHTLNECSDPNADPGADAAKVQEKRDSVIAGVGRDALALAAVVRKNPRSGERELRAALKVDGHKWGVERLEAAKLLLKAGHKGVRLVDRAVEDSRERAWDLVLEEGQSDG